MNERTPKIVYIKAKINKNDMQNEERITNTIITR